MFQFQFTSLFALAVAMNPAAAWCPLGSSLLSPRISPARGTIQRKSLHINARRVMSDSDSPLLDDFKTAAGDVVNPYAVLGVPRTASRSEIKASYRSLSKRYHPDGIRQRDDGILPGSCNNLDDVREHWERIKLSYEILSDKKMRIRYDRNSALADPGAALGRAALSTVGWGLASVGKGLFKVGEMAFSQMKEDVSR